MSATTNPDYTLAKFDRLRGGLNDVALFTKPSTVKNVQNLTGKAETFVVETARYEELGGDYIFIECMDENGCNTLALPPRVTNAIASQRASRPATAPSSRSGLAEHLWQDGNVGQRHMSSAWLACKPQLTLAVKMRST